MPLEIKKNKISEKKTPTSEGVPFSDILNIEFGQKKNNDRFKEYIYNQLYILVSSGVDLKSALHLLESDAEKKHEKVVLNTLYGKLINGKSFSEALSELNEFSAYEFHSVKIGEETGKLLLVLKDLSLFYNKKIKQRRQIVSSLTYPGIVFSVAMSAIFFLMFYMVPMFSDIFKRFGGDLPYITQVVISISEFIKSYFLLFILAVTFFVVFISMNKHKLWFRKFSSKILLKTPIVGDIASKIFISRFSQSMALLISSKVSIDTSISLVKNMIGFYPIESTLDAIKKDLVSGVSLHNAMSKHPVFPKKLVLMIKVGEQVNKLDVFFDKIANQYSEEVDYKVSIMSNLMEPFLIVFLGLIVGIVLVAMYLPMFELGNLF